MEIRALVSLLGVSLLAACAVEKGGNAQPSTYPVSPSGRLLVTTSDFKSGRLAAAAPGSSHTCKTIHHDSVLRWPTAGDHLYVVERENAVVRVFEKKGCTETTQYSVGKGTNAQDIVLVGENDAYVSRMGAADLLRVDRLTGAIRSAIPLGKYAAPKEIGPSQYLMHAVEDRVVIALQRLIGGFKTSGKSLMAVLDPAKDQLLGEPRDLTFQNPFSDWKTGPDGDLYLTEVGTMLRFDDGGVERFDRKTLVSKGVLVREDDFKGDLLDIEILDDKRAVVLVSAATTRLLSFRYHTGKVTDVVQLLEAKAFDYTQLRLDRAEHALYVTDRSDGKPGVRRFDTETLKETTFLPLPLPPFWIVLAP